MNTLTTSARLLMLLLVIAIFLPALSGAGAGAEATLPRPSGPEEPAVPPDWFVKHMRWLVEGSGRWTTDIAEGRGEDEPYDEYGVEWRWGLGQRSLQGRLFAIVDGIEVASFWEYRLYWHPGEGHAVLLQFGGNGTVGSGIMQARGGEGVEIDQEFFGPDGSKTRVRHETEPGGAGEQVIRVFHEEDGGWKLQRNYLWVRS
jgi:hypothetical protein